MSEPNFNYDELGDNLYVCYSPGERGTYLEITDHILLRVNESERRVIGVTLLDYRILSQKTELGPRQFPLIGLANLTPELRELALELLNKPPVSDILATSVYTLSITDETPIVMVRPIEAVKIAA